MKSQFSIVNHFNSFNVSLSSIFTMNHYESNQGITMFGKDSLLIPCSQATINHQSRKIVHWRRFELLSSKPKPHPNWFNIDFAPFILMAEQWTVNHHTIYTFLAFQITTNDIMSLIINGFMAFRYHDITIRFATATKQKTRSFREKIEYFCIHSF